MLSCVVGNARYILARSLCTSNRFISSRKKQQAIHQLQAFNLPPQDNVHHLAKLHIACEAAQLHQLVPVVQAALLTYAQLVGYIQDAALPRDLRKACTHQSLHGPTACLSLLLMHGSNHHLLQLKASQRFQSMQFSMNSTTTMQQLWNVKQSQRVLI